MVQGKNYCADTPPFSLI